MQVEWTRERPASPGHYWKYGVKIELVRVVAEKGTLLGLDGDAVVPINEYASHVLWAPAVLPDPPVRKEVPR